MVQSLVCPRGICTWAGVTTAVVSVVTVPAAGTKVLGGIVGMAVAATGDGPVEVEDDEAAGTKGTVRVCGLCGMIVLGTGVVCGGGGAVGGTGAMLAVGVTCGEVMACAGDKADADDEDDAAAMAAAAAAATGLWSSALTTMLVGVEVAIGETTIVDDGVGCTVATLTGATGDDGGGGGEDELGSLLVVDVAVCCSTAFRLGDGLRGWSCCCWDSRDVAAAFGEDAAVGGGLADRTVGSVLMGRFSGGECTIQASHCSGPGSRVIR